MGLSCLITNNSKPLEALLETGNSTDVIKMIENLSTHDYGDNRVCRVRLSFDHNKQWLSITFTEHLENSTLEDRNIHIDILLQPDMIKDISIWNHLEYACSYDGCEKKIIIMHLFWFIGVDHSEAVNELVMLISNTVEKSGQYIHCFS